MRYLQFTLGLFLLPFLQFYSLIQASNEWTAEHTLHAIEINSEVHSIAYESLVCIVGYETGWTFNPYAIGDGGKSHGVAQLHEKGLLPLFYRWGYSNPYNPYEAVDFLGAAINHGYKWNWTPVLYGLCYVEGR